ncbi:hypothetical protein AAFF_G00257030 [Aldrovandia affinis]|uniref:Chemokine interleukin-8-like domain-containing protein n=1 Tax=Aldrovandia affinis TaxID=143900 RepID=A0AAD7ST44_9TELE|nr:hypothetical protein AAFF_G00257030 [Aldrovandia affinis]
MKQLLQSFFLSTFSLSKPTDRVMMFRALFFLLLLACLHLSLAQGPYENCCLRYVPHVRRSTRNMVVSYRRQQTDGGCNIPAIVFMMKLPLRKPFCADPNAGWVKRLMKLVDKRQAYRLRTKT